MFKSAKEIERETKLQGLIWGVLLGVVVAGVEEEVGEEGEIISEEEGAMAFLETEMKEEIFEIETDTETAETLDPEGGALEEMTTETVETEDLEESVTSITTEEIILTMEIELTNKIQMY